MREAAKKEKERAYLERFRECFAYFPKAKIVPSEHPDFLMETQPRRIGIELTEYHVQEAEEGRGSPMRAREGTEDKVLRTASLRHQSKGLPPVTIHVHWNSHQAFGSRRVRELATDLADLVQEHLPELGHEAAIRRRHPAGRSLPREVTSLTVIRRKSIMKNSWTSVRAAFVPTLTISELQRIMRNKEAKVHSYRRRCQEVWLLIVARGLEPSTFGDLGPEVEANWFESGFDRVFFLHYFDGSVSELRVRSRTLDSPPVEERPAVRSAQRARGSANKEDDA